jgi:hypothetical protein
MARGVYVGAGGSATATANVSANGGAGSATAQAVGGASAIAAGAAVASSSVSDATSGLAQATARTSDGAGDEVIAQARAPVGGPASAAAKANIGKGETPSVTLAAGLAESVAALTPGALTFGAGAMSAGYGGEGESLSYTDSADFYFATAAAGTLYVDLISSASSGVGFDSLELDVEVNGENHTYSFTNLASPLPICEPGTLLSSPLFPPVPPLVRVRRAGEDGGRRRRFRRAAISADRRGFIQRVGAVCGGSCVPSGAPLAARIPD